MMITDAIREAQSEYAVYFLLTDYVETLQFSRIFPAQVVRLPLAGLVDVRDRLDRLAAHFETTMRLMDTSTCDIVSEAIVIFDAAIRRVSELPRQNAARVYDLTSARRLHLTHAS